MTKIGDYRDQSLEELQANYEDLKRQIFELRNQRELEKKMEKPHALRQNKKDIARILTVMREKQMAS